MKLLLIEDDLMLANGLSKALSNEGFVIDCAYNGDEGINLAISTEPDIVILDLGLPDIDGMDVLKKLRSANTPNRNVNNLPILILTARSSLPDKVTALDQGADDYLGKPFEIAELLARIRVLARRLGTSNTNIIHIHNVTLDTSANIVTVDNHPLELTQREFMILKSLMENAGRIQTKDMIENKLYGWGQEIASNTIEVHISNLRKKLPNHFIKTIRGLGYTINNKYSANKQSVNK